MNYVVEIKDRVAKYILSDKKPVCANSGDTIKFVFDDEWSAHEKKTARFIYRNMYHDVEFTGDTCEVPVITKAKSFDVGVYVGEMAEGDELLSSTQATIPCNMSIRCVTSAADANTGKNYTNEAKGYAEEAKAAAKAAARGFQVVGTYEEPCITEDSSQIFAGEVCEWSAMYDEEGAGGKWFIIGSSNEYVARELKYDLGYGYENQLYTLFKDSTFVVLNFVGITASFGDRDEDYKEVTGGLAPLFILDPIQVSRESDILPIVEERLGNPMHSCLVEVHDYEGSTHHCLYLSDFVTSTLAYAYEDGIVCSLRFTGYSDRVEE